MRLLVVALLGGAILAGCGDDEEAAPAAATATATPAETATPAPEPAQTSSPKPRRGTVIATGDSQFGPVMFDGDQQAIYIFDLEKTDESQCYDACAEAWPPVLTEGEPAAAGDIRQGLLGTTERDDGTTQVTYNGHPLYYYAHEGPGEVKCHDIPGFGGQWYAVRADGNRVT